jgi:hypothetical protein
MQTMRRRAARLACGLGLVVALSSSCESDILCDDGERIVNPDGAPDGGYCMSEEEIDRMDRDEQIEWKIQSEGGYP